MPTHSLANLMSRLSRAGFKREVVRNALLPDWWDDSLSSDNALLSEIEIRVARFLNRPISEVRNPSVSLNVPIVSGAVLRRTRPVDSERLWPAIHTALAVANAVVRCIPDSPVNVPPDDALSWRESLRSPGRAVQLVPLVRDLWSRGIPVVPIDCLPSPSFQGLACIIDGRPVIVVGYQHDEPGRLAFLLGHETGHIVRGDCTPGRPVVDQDDQVADETDIERRADAYATRLMVGGAAAPEVEAATFRDLANRASALERSTGADATAIIFSWARMTDDYTTASMAVKALYRSAGGRNSLRTLAKEKIDLNSASESDRELLRLVIGDSGIESGTD